MEINKIIEKLLYNKGKGKRVQCPICGTVNKVRRINVAKDYVYRCGCCYHPFDLKELSDCILIDPKSE